MRLMHRDGCWGGWGRKTSCCCLRKECKKEVTETAAVAASGEFKRRYHRVASPWAGAAHAVVMRLTTAVACRVRRQRGDRMWGDVFGEGGGRG